jgi:hypothetical protein
MNGKYGQHIQHFAVFTGPNNMAISSQKVDFQPLKHYINDICDIYNTNY